MAGERQEYIFQAVLERREFHDVNLSANQLPIQIGHSLVIHLKHPTVVRGASSTVISTSRVLSP